MVERTYLTLASASMTVVSRTSGVVRDFFVTDTTGPALFGLPLIKGLNLLDTQKDIDNVTSTCSKQSLNKAAVLADFFLIRMFRRHWRVEGHVSHHTGP